MKFRNQNARNPKVNTLMSENENDFSRINVDDENILVAAVFGPESTNMSPWIGKGFLQNGVESPLFKLSMPSIKKAEFLVNDEITYSGPPIFEPITPPTMEIQQEPEPEDRHVANDPYDGSRDNNGEIGICTTDLINLDPNYKLEIITPDDPDNQNGEEETDSDEEDKPDELGKSITGLPNFNNYNNPTLDNDVSIMREFVPCSSGLKLDMALDRLLSAGADEKASGTLERQFQALKRQFQRIRGIKFIMIVLIHLLLLTSNRYKIIIDQIKRASCRVPNWSSSQRHERQNARNRNDSKMISMLTWSFLVLCQMSLFQVIDGVDFIDCKVKEKGFLLDIPKTVNCSIQNITQTPENWNVSLYVPRVEPKYISAVRCYKIRHRYCIHVTFPWTAGVEVRSDHVEPISEKECRDAVLTKSFMNYRILKVNNDTWSTNISLSPTRPFCCADSCIEYINFYIIDDKVHTYDGVKIVADIDRPYYCKYSNGFCKMLNVSMSVYI